MGMLFSEAGKAILLDAMRHRLHGLWIGLFVNNFTPDRHTKLADFAGATFPGYSPQRLHHWSHVYIQHGGAAATRAAFRRFTQIAVPTPKQTVYGYYVWDDRGWYCWAEMDPDGGVVMGLAPQDYWVSPVMTFDQAAPLMSAPRKRKQRRSKRA